MKKTLFSLALVAILGMLPMKAFSQASLSYYSMSHLSKIGAAYDFSPKLWSELRLYTNTHIRDFTPELMVAYNLTNKEYHSIYVGVGVVVNNINGILIPAGIRFTPFDKLDRFSLHLSLEPLLDFDDGDLYIMSGWGLRYKFIK